jgi:hypothetical protein
MWLHPILQTQEQLTHNKKYKRQEEEEERKK